MQGLNLYEEHSNAHTMDKLIHDHSTLVIKIAKKIKRKLPSYIELNDLLQSGFIGLIEASKTFKEGHGATFETFASIRIKGAIIDDLRKNSWNSREAIKDIKELAEAVHRVEQRHKKPATSEEIAAELNISIEEHDKMCQRINMNNVLQMNALEDYNFLPGTEEGPEELVIEDNINYRIKEILQTLPEREQILLSLYYIEELTFSEISEVLDLTEARICQLHATAIAKIKQRLNK